MARRQSPATVLARKLAVAMARHLTRIDPANKHAPNYDMAFNHVYANSSASGLRSVARWIEALNADMDMIATAKHIQGVA